MNRTKIPFKHHIMLSIYSIFSWIYAFFVFSNKKMQNYIRFVPLTYWIKEHIHMKPDCITYIFQCRYIVSLCFSRFEFKCIVKQCINAENPLYSVHITFSHCMIVCSHSVCFVPVQCTSTLRYMYLNFLFSFHLCMSCNFILSFYCYGMLQWKWISLDEIK